MDDIHQCCLIIGFYFIEEIFLISFIVRYKTLCMVLQVDIAAGGWHSTALTDDGEVRFMISVQSTIN